MDDLESLRVACLEPIPGASPYGVEPTITMDEFRNVTMIIEKYSQGLTKISGDPAEMEQWGKAIDDCVIILQTHGKDFRVMCWLCEGLVRINGIPGLKTGLAILNHFLKDHPELLHPQRVRPRANTITTFGEFIRSTLVKYGKYLEQNKNKLDPEEITAFTDMHTEFITFYESALDAFQDEKYDFQNLRMAKETASALAKMLKPPAKPAQPSKPEPPVKEEKTTALPEQRESSETAAEKITEESGDTAVASQGSAATQSLDQSTAKLKTEEATTTVDKAALIRELATFAFKFRSSFPLDALAFRLLRLAKWNLIENLPPTKPQTKRTRLPGPRSAVAVLKDRERRAAKNEKLDHVSFIETCERWFSDYPFWLDLQYNLFASAEKGGLQAIAAVVAEETARFVRRLGVSILDLEFDDGTPFASDITRQWLQSMSATPSTAPAATQQTSSAALDSNAKTTSGTQLHTTPQQSTSETKAPVIVTTERATTPLDSFIQERYKELASGRTVECLKRTAQQLLTVQAVGERWRLLLVAGTAAALIPNKKLLAVAIMRECRALAEQYTLKSLQPLDYSKVLLALRDLGDTSEGGSFTAQEKNWITITTEALRMDPAAVLLHDTVS